MKKEIKFRVVTFLERQELDFLDNISKDILFSKGIKIPRTALIKSIIDILLKENDEKVNYKNLVDQILSEFQKGGNDEM